ncbi:MAG: tRNA pseudouridine(13) synthase TruD [Candidatus Thiodiazotropha sp. L084R]
MTDKPWKPIEQLPYAYGGGAGTGMIRHTPEDFRVDEVLGFSPDDEGEHLLVQIRKRKTNTQWLAGQLAKLAGISAKDVGYAGMKDRHAVTTQWFSLGMAGRPEPEWKTLEDELIQVLAVHRHRRKLRRGSLRGNRFVLCIRQLNVDQTLLEKRLRQLKISGMPNYFGEQRFGHDYSNLTEANRLFSPERPRMARSLRGLVISAARSQLFNQVLAERIAQGVWNSPLQGDYFNLDGSRSGFPSHEEEDDLLAKRCLALDIHPTGPLWGRGRNLVSDDSGDLEARVLEPFDLWRNGLEHVGLNQERRSLRISLSDLDWRFLQDGSLELDFFLPAGCFATALLRELIDYSADS